MDKSVRSDADEQRSLALKHANEVRLARAGMKRSIRNGQLSVAEVVLTCPWQAQKMSISDLLMSQQRWGQARCRRLLLSVGIPEDKKVGTLTERQRTALVAVLNGKVRSEVRRRQLRPVPRRAHAARECALSAV